MGGRIITPSYGGSVRLPITRRELALADGVLSGGDSAHPVDPPGQQNESVADGALIADTAVSFSDSSHPNEPSGMTQLQVHTFASKEPAGWTLFNDDGDDLELVGGRGRANYPSGYTGGGPPFQLYVDAYSRSTVYLFFKLIPSSNWQGHNSYINKIFFLKDLGTSQSSNPHVYVMMRGKDDGALQLDAVIQNDSGSQNLYWDDSGAHSNEVSPSSGQVTFARNAEASVEVQLVMNTGDATADGEVHMWKDGIKTHQFTGLTITYNSNDYRFNSCGWDPVWGGNADSVDADMYMELDDIYLSGKN